jgi:hypothetical protein
MTHFTDAIESFTLHQAVTFQNLSMFPLIGTPSSEPDYVTLDEAAGKGFVHITEVSESGSVPQLRLENSGMSPVLLLDGEQLIGAKQNRVLNLTVLAPAGKTIEIPVSCVEAGRWIWDSPMFSASERTHFAAGRARKAASVSESMASGRGRYSDQAEVWDGIAMKAQRMDSRSSTSAMESVYQRHEASIEDYLVAMRPVDGQAGAVFAIGDRVIGMDVFAHPATFHKLYRKIVSGYAVDALEATGEARTTDTGAAQRFLDAVTTSKPSEYPAVGLGTDLRYNAAGLAVAALVNGRDTVHLCAFALDEDGVTGSGFSRIVARARNRSRTH